MVSRGKFFGLRVVMAILLIAVLICGWILLEPAFKIDGLEQLDAQKLAISNHSPAVFDNYGNPVSENLVLWRIYTPFEQIPKHTVDAFVSIEDKRFFEHSGIDYYRILGAVKRNAQSGSFGEGASTITQQLVKNTHLNNDKNIKRKVMEMRIAVDIERRYPKEKIMEMYLNAIYFGNNIYGIGRASLFYFDKSVSELDLNESAILAGIINNPSRYNPVVNVENANNRRKLVLKQMLSQHKITQTEFDSVLNEDVHVNSVNFDQYANFLTAECAKALNNGIFLNGYTVYTYLDQDLESKINQIVRKYRFDGCENAVIHAIVMNSSGEVLANCANTNASLVRNYRQPASVIKPAVSFAPALEKRLISPITLINDQPEDFDGYTPQNYKNKNYGWISATDALKYSQNVPAVRLTNECGVEYCKSVATKLGYVFDSQDKNLAVALGGLSKGATLTQIANSYQAFANGGEFIKCSHIKKIVDPNGVTVYLNPHKAERAIDEDSAYLINDMLKECVRDGTGKRIKEIGADKARFVSAKTGTVGNSDGNSDAYIVAYTRDHIVAVWIGAKNGLSVLKNGVTGGTYPAEIATKILELLPIERDFEMPKSVVEIDIDKREYKDNRTVMIASADTVGRDKFKAKFSRANVPKLRGRQHNYMLDSEVVDWRGFKLTTDKFSTDRFLSDGMSDLSNGLSGRFQSGAGVGGFSVDNEKNESDDSLNLNGFESKKNYIIVD